MRTGARDGKAVSCDVAALAALRVSEELDLPR